jgi:hypothetical protein
MFRICKEWFQTIPNIKNAENYSLSVSFWKFLADVRSMSNYYPYGMAIEAGSWSGGGYNYGYNGMLKERNTNKII